MATLRRKRRTTKKTVSKGSKSKGYVTNRGKKVPTARKRVMRKGGLRKSPPRKKALPKRK